jgi:hypothetical protein
MIVRTEHDHHAEHKIGDEALLGVDWHGIERFGLPIDDTSGWERDFHILVVMVDYL